MDVFNPPPPGTEKRKPGRPPGAKDKVPRKKPERKPRAKDAKQQGGGKELEDLAAEIPEQKFADDAVQQVPELKPGRNMLLCSMSGGGKSTVLMQLDLSGFHNVFVITLTKHAESPVLALATSPDHVLEGMDDTFLEGLMEFHKHHRKARTLLLFEDRVGMDFNFKQSRPYKVMTTASRHFGISVIDSVQDIAEVPKNFRRNAHYLLFGPNYDANNEMIADELAFPGLEKPKFRVILRKIFKDQKHQWMVYDGKRKDWWIWQPEYVAGLSESESEDDGKDEPEQNDDSSEAESDVDDADTVTIPVSAFKKRERTVMEAAVQQRAAQRQRTS